jgi:hypothetical protein
MTKLHYLFRLIILIIFIGTIHQLFVLSSVLSDLLNGISSGPFIRLTRANLASFIMTKTNNDTMSDAPRRVIHQTWKSRNLSSFPIETSSQSWETSRFYEGMTLFLSLTFLVAYEHRLWIDSDIEDLIRSSYPWLLTQYLAYPYTIQRIDIARIVILHAHGGIYADMDAFPSIKSLQMFENTSCTILPGSTSKGLLTNHFMMAEKGLRGELLIVRRISLSFLFVEKERGLC